MDDSCENDVPPPEANEPFSEVPPSDQGSAANAKRADKSGKKREGENLTESGKGYLLSLAESRFSITIKRFPRMMGFLIQIFSAGKYHSITSR